MNLRIGKPTMILLSGEIHPPVLLRSTALKTTKRKKTKIGNYRLWWANASKKPSFKFISILREL